MLRSACSGMWHHSRLQQLEFWRRPAQLKIGEIGAHLWHSSFKRQSTYHENGKPGCWSSGGETSSLCHGDALGCGGVEE